MRFLYPLSLAASLLAAGCTLNVNHETETVELKKAAGNITALSISDDLMTDGVNLTDGNTVSVTGTDADTVFASLTLGRLETESKPMDVSQVRLTLSSAGALGFSCPVEGWQRLSLTGLAVTAPCNLPLTINSTSGDIAVTGMDSSVTIDQTSGNISVDSSKSVSIENVSGTVSVSCYAGGSISTTSGNITVRILMDSLHAGFTGLSLDAVSGNILVLVPDSLAAQLDLDCTSGDIKVDGSGNYSNTLKAGAGSYTIKCEATSGDITVTYY